MSIRLDPRRLAALKLLAGEEGLRPGELVTRWVEERLDAARGGQAASPSARPAGGASADALQSLSDRVDELARRLDAFTATAPAVSTPAESMAPSSPAEATAPKRRGRPPKSGSARVSAQAEKEARVPLHEEISAVIAERGPMTAGELATAIAERGRYAAPRSAKPLDGATISARVSNPVYRSRFTRNKGRIGLSDAG
jgi:hypothetical protein